MPTIHLALTGDGETVLADYDYSSVELWCVGEERQLCPPLAFSDAVGINFDLGYDVVKSLRNLQSGADGSVRGAFPGGIQVVIRKEVAGTAITPANEERLVFSVSDAMLEHAYPMRGGELVSRNGRWFVMSSSTISLDYASGLRVYEVATGLPVTSILIHQVEASPGAKWPRQLSSMSTEFDPVIGAFFIRGSSILLTVSRNGLLRRWNLGETPRDKPTWVGSLKLGMALTGRRMAGEMSTLRLSQGDILSLRSPELLRLRSISRYRDCSTVSHDEKSNNAP
jgi:hypothetical protein